MHHQRRRSMMPVFLESKYYTVSLLDQTITANNLMYHKPPNSTSRSVQSTIPWECYRYSYFPQHRKLPYHSLLSSDSRAHPSEQSDASDQQQSGSIVAILARMASSSAQVDNRSLDRLSRMLSRQSLGRKVKMQQEASFPSFKSCRVCLIPFVEWRRIKWSLQVFKKPQRCRTASLFPLNAVSQLAHNAY